MRSGILAVGLVLLSGTQAAAEWQVTPSFGISFGGDTTFRDFEQAAGSPQALFGIRGAWLGEVFGFEGDLGTAPGFFQKGVFRFGGETPGGPGATTDVGSNVTTLTGNVVVALPRRIAEFTLRPYGVGGVGLMRVRIDDLPAGPPVASTLTVVDVGGGVTGFLSDRIGINWDVRRFWSLGGIDQELGFSIGPEQLSFWRASMGLAIRF